jgi:hypothetical protein
MVGMDRKCANIWTPSIYRGPLQRIVAQRYSLYRKFYAEHSDDEKVSAHTQGSNALFSPLQHSTQALRQVTTWPLLAYQSPAAYTIHNNARDAGPSPEHVKVYD